MPDEFELEVPPALRAGVWANRVQLHVSTHEFTLDLSRRDPDDPERGVLVARVALSASLLSELKDVIDGAWREYARGALPPEIQDG